MSFGHAKLMAGLTAVWLLWPGQARAQETREEQIAQAQAEKAQHLVPEGPNRAEQIVVEVMKSPLLAGTGGVFPWFGSVYEGTGAGFGVGYLRRMPRASQLTTIAGISINGSTLLRADYQAPRLFAGRIAPYASGRWARAKDVSFFGVGNDSSHDLRAGYFFDPAYLNAGVVFHATDWLRFIGGYEYLTFSTHITALNNLEFPDLADNRRLHFNGSVVGAVIDTRTSPGYSTRGTLLRATSYYYSETSDQPFEFRQTEYEAGQLVPLVSEQFVLAFRGLATFTNPDSGNSAPLALLPYIGSGSTLRGFENRRFVDRDRLVLTGEYRWRPSRYLDMAIFLDAGQVAHTTNEIAWNRLKTSYGIGARFHGPNFTALRVELAHSVEGLQFVITTGQPF